MNKSININQTVPGFATHPGEILKDELETRNISQTDFAKQIGFQKSQLNEILNGKRGINADLALLLEESLKIDAEYWMNVQKTFELDEAKISKKNAQRITAIAKWNMVEELIPVSYFKRQGVISGDPINDITVVKEVYQVNQLEDIAVQYATCKFRKSDALNTDRVNLLGWDKLVKYLVKDVQVSKFNLTKQEDLLCELNTIFLKNKTVLARVESTLKEYGIKFIQKEKPSKTPVDGASFWSNGHPAIACTLRHKRIDNFAFTLFHELGHIYLHLVNNNEAEFIDIEKSEGVNSNNAEEKQADAFANDNLIPIKEWEYFYKSSVKYTDIDIKKFAKEIKVNPAIIRGRISHLRNEFGGKTGISYAIG